MTSLVEIEKPRSRGNALIESCFDIVRDLPEHFDESAYETVRRDLGYHDLHVARGTGGIIGFATVKRKNEKVAELSWMAVAPDARRNGVGASLLEAVVEELRKSEVEILIVKTLAEEAGYAPYEDTRRFYEGNGFALVETIDPYPGWEPVRHIRPNTRKAGRSWS